MVGSTVHAVATADARAQAAVGQHSAGSGVAAAARLGARAFGAAKAATQTVVAVRAQQASDPLRRRLPLDWAELPAARVGTLVLAGGGGGGVEAAAAGRACWAVLKLRGRTGRGRCVLSFSRRTCPSLC